MRYVIGIVYGLLVASVYIAFKYYTNQNPILLFTLTSLVVVVIHFLSAPAKVIRALKNKQILIRASLFAITQILLLQSQDIGSTSATFLAAAVGNLFGMLLSYLVLKESFSLSVLIAVFFATIGSIIEPKMISFNFLGLFAGILQGITTAITRSMMKEQFPIFENVVAGFVISFFFGLLYLAFFKSSFNLQQITLSKVISFSILIVLIQYSFFTIYRFWDVSHVYVFNLTRIPWAVLIEVLVYGLTLSLRQCISSAIILVAAICLILAQLFKSQELQLDAE